jgi:hypothetical protein
VATDEAAEKMRAQYKAGYVVWGTVTIVGDDCSIDMRVRDKSGQVWAKGIAVKTSQIIAAVSAACDDINKSLFGREKSQAIRTSGGPGQSSGRVNQMNPGLTMNEKGNREVYLNPQFRYSGSRSEEDSRLRSQVLPFSSIGMEVVDCNGNGQNEIFLLDDHKVYAYRYEGQQLKSLGEFQLPLTHQALSIRSLRRPSGLAWIIVNTVDATTVPSAFILTFDGSNFKTVMKGLRWYLNVVQVPPHFSPTLVGQEAQPPRLFRPGVSELVVQGGQLVPAKRVALPEDTNVFTFAWLPAGSSGKEGDKLVVLTKDENLRVYTPTMSRLSQTSEKFSGSSVGLEIDPSMPGLGREDVTMPSIFYIPMRMIPTDLDHDGSYEMIVNKPISTASQIFDRYRFFPQSEIQSLFWDGVGLTLQWKTRRIKGSVVDYTVADANNDGITDLVVCINTHPGAIGVKARKTMVMLYPLDLSKTDPNTPVDRSEVEE